jgi:lysyl endopeptidase
MMKKLLLILSAGALLLSTPSFAQVSIGGEPISFKGKVAALMDDQNVHTQVLPPLDMRQVQNEDLQDEQLGKLHRISRFHDVSYNMSNSGTWTTLPGGAKIWKLKIKATDAIGSSLIFDGFHMPAGATMFVYNSTRTEWLGGFTAQNNKNHGGFATGVLNGESFIIEYFEPANVAGQGQISLAQVAHIYRDITPVGPQLRGGDPCEVDVNCSPEGDNWQDEKRGAVRILVVGPSGSGWCSGSVINNTSLDCTPYVLTALHCGESSTTANFNNYVFYFNFEAATCGGGASATQSTTGCIKRADSGDGGGNQGSDFLLVEMDAANITTVLQTYNAYWNGWNANNSGSGSGVSIHHPAGAKKKISTYTSTLTSTTWGGTPNTHWLVTWVSTANGHGVTEGGSSGSPIFDNNGRIVGQLTGGSSYCTSPNSPDRYGKMSYNWNSNPGDDLRDWLDPGNTGAMTLDGAEFPCTPAVADDAGIDAIIDPQGNFCGTNIVPQVTLKNFGANTLTSVTINYDIDGGPNQTFNWTGSLATSATANVTLPAMSTTNGAHVFNASTSNPNGNTDGNASNDADLSNFTTIANGQQIDLALTLDCWGDETSWELQDAATTVLYSGGPYTQGLPDGAGTINESWCLDVGCYDFIINDTYGDGMYGSQWGTCNVDGDYQITDAGSNVLASTIAANADYGNQEVNNFCVTAAGVTADFVGSPTTVCAGSQVAFSDLSTGSPNAWTWTFQGGTPGSSNAQNPLITYNTPGTYNVTLFADDGSTNDTKVVNGYITVTSNPSITATGTDITCNGDNDGSATTNVTGGTPSYTYSWTPSGGNSATASNLAGGTYTVTVTDANGCTGSDNVVITDPAVLTVSTSTTQANCGSNDGTATASASGGTGGYTYSWTSGGSSATETNLGLGTYTVTVTDANGCTASADATITNPNGPTVAATATDETCDGDCDGTLSATATGGTPGYTYTWDIAGSGANHSNVCAGSHEVTVTDNNGCSDIMSVTVIAGPTYPVGSFVVNPSTNEPAGTPITFVNTSSGGGTTSWDFGDTQTSSQSSPTHTYTSPGTYTVTLILDNGGCTDTVSVVVTITSGIGIEENDLIDMVQIYPNPSTGLVSLVLDMDVEDKTKVDVLDAIGKVVYSTQLMEGNKTYQIDLSDQAEGLYFLNLKVGNETVTKKIAVIR